MQAKLRFKSRQQTSCVRRGAAVGAGTCARHVRTVGPAPADVPPPPLPLRRCASRAVSAADSRSRASRLVARCCALDWVSDSTLARSRCSKSQWPVR